LYRILLITVLLIAYGSLWPWQYKPAHATGSPPLILLHSWPAKIDASDIEDIVVNLLLYLPVGMFGYLALDRHQHRRLRVIGPIVLGFVLSCAIEMTQIFDNTRNCSALDVLCNTVSTALGVLLGFVFRESLLASLRRPASAHIRHASGPLVLLYFWVGFETIPLFPLTAKIAPKLHLFATNSSVVECLASFTAWLIVARLLEAIYSPTLAWRLLLLLSLLAPAKIFIAQRTITLSELAGLAAALLIYRTGAIRNWLVASLTVVILVVRGLTPFHFTAHNHFSWLPFVALLQSQWENGLIVLCEKCFWYGAAVWLLWASGRWLLTATALVATVLAVIEVLQLRLPGRTAEVTDPLLAIILGTVLWLLETHGRRARVRTPEPDLAGVER
jgi:VanZ family protein